MVPEFISRNGSEPITEELEKLTCWENQVVMLMCFHRLGYKNIIASDIDVAGKCFIHGFLRMD